LLGYEMLDDRTEFQIRKCSGAPVGLEAMKICFPVIDDMVAKGEHQRQVEENDIVLVHNFYFHIPSK
jgi:hypothetical protein